MNPLLRFLGSVARSNLRLSARPYKLNFAVTYRCQSRCLTCVRPDELILGDNMAIQDLQVGQRSVGVSGLEEVEATTARDYEGEMVRVRASGLLPFEVTPEHLIFVAKSQTRRIGNRRTYSFQGPDWKEAKEVLPKPWYEGGDYLVTPILEGTFDTRELDLTPFGKGRGAAIARGRGRSLSLPLDEGTAWFMGAYTAEGCPDSSGIRFDFNKRETPLHEKVMVTARRLGYTPYKYDSRTTTTIHVSSRLLMRAFPEWFGRGAPNKKAPDFIMLHRSKRIVEAFLSGWEEGDGHPGSRRFSGSTVSKVLALQTQLMYASLGRVANINLPPSQRARKGEFNGRPVNLHDSYRVSYSFGKSRYAKVEGNCILRPVRTVERVFYRGPVHNIRTPDSTYLVSNAVVHNCNIWKTHPEGELDLQEITRFAKLNPIFKWVQLTGGEPFLRPDLVPIVKAFAESSGPYILSLPTNCLCNPDMVRERMEAIADLAIPRIALTLSLDGYGSLHDKVRGVPGNFERVMEAYSRLEYLKGRKGLSLIFGYTASRFNQGQLEKTVLAVKERFPEVCADDFHLNMAQNSYNYYQNQNDGISPDPQAFVPELEWVLKNKHREDAFNLVEYPYLKGLKRFSMRRANPMRSRELDASLFLDSFGNVFPSVMWNMKIGSIRESGYDLRPIWEGDDAEKARKMVKQGHSPQHWTSCEAYQTLLGSVWKLLWWRIGRFQD